MSFNWRFDCDTNGKETKKKVLFTLFIALFITPDSDFGRLFVRSHFLLLG